MCYVWDLGIGGLQREIASSVVQHVVLTLRCLLCYIVNIHSIMYTSVYLKMFYCVALLTLAVPLCQLTRFLAFLMHLFPYILKYCMLLGKKVVMQIKALQQGSTSIFYWCGFERAVLVFWPCDVLTVWTRTQQLSWQNFPVCSRNLPVSNSFLSGNSTQVHAQIQIWVLSKVGMYQLHHLPFCFLCILFWVVLYWCWFYGYPQAIFASSPLHVP